MTDGEISFSMAAFSEMGKRSNNVDTLVVIFLSPVVHPPEFGAEFRIGRVRLYWAIPLRRRYSSP